MDENAEPRLCNTFYKVAIASIFLIILFGMTSHVNAYVELQDKVSSYVTTNNESVATVKTELLTQEDEAKDLVALNSKASTTFQFVSENSVQETILNKIKESTKPHYKVYKVINGSEEDTQVLFNIKEDAENFVTELKTNYSDVTEELKIEETYVEEITLDTENQKLKLVENLQVKQDAINEVKSRTVNGIYFEVTPVLGGYVSSRYGSVESIRDHVHGGLDIASREGTPIYAIAAGTVIEADWDGSGYGNLVVIDHGNGVETWYAHCSALNVEAGTYVEAGELIAYVGSTGYATGPHLHLEVRIDGLRTDPQDYLYTNE